MKKLISRILTGCIVLCSTALLSVAALSIAWFSSSTGQTDKEAVDGEIGLRGYYYTGNGSESDPYEIVNATHFYNLSRLQNLGIYKEKKYFQIGHDFGGDIGIACINSYTNGTPNYEKRLDMSRLSAGRTIYPIGNEATPFKGVFVGNGIPIDNLTVTGYPDDIGVFGYVDYSGSVDGLVCNNLTINSLGYTTTREKDDYKLFSADIDEIFRSTSYFAREANLTLHRYSGGEWITKGLKQDTGFERIINLNGTNQYDANNIYKYAYFTVDYPSTTNRPFKYDITISSGLLEQNVSGFDSGAICINLDPLFSSATFNSADRDYQVDTRISIVASLEVEGYTFSRVIQSYNVEFHSMGKNYTTLSGSDGYFEARVFCDYIHNNLCNYHHGNNIGFLAGHVNGSMTNSYVCDSQLEFNSTGYTPIETESDTGLIGEIGKNIVNGIDPELGLVTDGDTGSINFTRIYNRIRGDANLNEDRIIGPWKLLTDEEYNSEIQFFGYDHPKWRRGQSRNSHMIPNWPSPGPVVNNLYFCLHYVNNGEPNDKGRVYKRFWNDDLTASATWNENHQQGDHGQIGYFTVGNGNPNIANGGNPITPTYQYNGNYYYFDRNDANLYDCFEVYDTPRLFYKYDPDYDGESGLISAVNDPVFCGVGMTTSYSSTANQFLSYISYDRFKKDGISEITYDIRYKGTDYPESLNVRDGDLFLNTSTHKLYRYDSETPRWVDLEALVDNQDPKETDIIKRKFGEYANTDYYYIYTYRVASVDYIKVYYHSQEDDTFSLFEDYLRKIVEDDSSNTSHYVTFTSRSMEVEHSHDLTNDEINNGYFNTVDFLWNKIIEDEPDVGIDRGLGVFKIITPYNSGAVGVSNVSGYKQFQYDNLGDSRIINGAEKTKVYFSTAEYDFDKSGTTNPNNYTWNTSAPLRATALPSYSAFESLSYDPYSDIHSFDYPFSRDYNYCFELNLSQMNQTEYTDEYMNRNNSPFLTNYLTSILYDKDGHHLTQGDDGFGISFIRANQENNSVERLSSLSSYMPVKSPFNKQKTQLNGKWYPPSSIAFTIDNGKGANVAVVGKGDDITIYSNDTGDPNSSSIKPKYAMRVKAANALDAHRYFEYDYTDGTVVTTIKHNDGDMKETNELYAHIFHLDQGDYVLGANSTTGTSDIYYLCVQGQDNAEIGTNGSVYMDNVIDNVDFLTKTPTYSDFVKKSLGRGNVSFSALFNEKFATTFYVRKKQYGSSGTYYVWFKFDDEGGQFVTSFITYSKVRQRHYIQDNANPYDDVRVEYR